MPAVLHYFDNRPFSATTTQWKFNNTKRYPIYCYYFIVAPFMYIKMSNKFPKDDAELNFNCRLEIDLRLDDTK